MTNESVKYNKKKKIYICTYELYEKYIYIYAKLTIAC